MDNRKEKKYIPQWMKKYPREIDTTSMQKAPSQVKYYTSRGNVLGVGNGNARGRKGSL